MPETVIGFPGSQPGKAFLTRDFSVLCAPASWCCTWFSVAQGRHGTATTAVRFSPLRKKAWVRESTAGKSFMLSVASAYFALPVNLLRYAPAWRRGRTGAASRRRPCTPRLRPAKSPLRGPFDLSLQASGRAEAASVQNTALSPHPCGLPRPSGNVSAILRPQHRQFQQQW